MVTGLLLVFFAVAGWAAICSAGWQPALGAGAGAPARQPPHDYEAKERLVAAYEQAGDYSSAFYQAAWLAWLAPQEYAESQAGAQYLRDRRARDRAASAQSAEAGIVIAAVDAARHLTESCLDGVIADQAARLQKQTTDQIAQAEKAAATLESRDPVVRMALVQLYLTLDDTLALQATPASRREEWSVLRKAAAHAQAVCDWLPQSPGAHRILGVVRARMAALVAGAAAPAQSDPARTAALDNYGGRRGHAAPVRELWELAIAECEKARQLDPKDPTLPELLWTLNLRAGHWEEATRWEAVCRPALSPPKGPP